MQEGAISTRIAHWNSIQTMGEELHPLYAWDQPERYASCYGVKLHIGQ